MEWSGGCDTKDEALARIQQREEAAVKRERAMAYAFSHQVISIKKTFLQAVKFLMFKTQILE